MSHKITAVIILFIICACVGMPLGQPWIGSDGRWPPPNHRPFPEPGFGGNGIGGQGIGGHGYGDHGFGESDFGVGNVDKNYRETKSTFSLTLNLYVLGVAALFAICSIALCVYFCCTSRRQAQRPVWAPGKSQNNTSGTTSGTTSSTTSGTTSSTTTGTTTPSPYPKQPPMAYPAPGPYAPQVAPYQQPYRPPY